MFQVVCGINAMHPLAQFQYPLDFPDKLVPYRVPNSLVQRTGTGRAAKHFRVTGVAMYYDRLEEIGLVKRQVPRSLQRRAARVNPPLEVRSEGPK